MKTKQTLELSGWGAKPVQDAMRNAPAQVEVKRHAHYLAEELAVAKSQIVIDDTNEGTNES